MVVMGETVVVMGGGSGCNKRSVIVIMTKWL